jgi:UDP-glucose 6-dehydrogenase
MREAPARELMEALWKANVNVQAYDPNAMVECQSIYGTRSDLTLAGAKESSLTLLPMHWLFAQNRVNSKHLTLTLLRNS